MDNILHMILDEAALQSTLSSVSTFGLLVVIAVSIFILSRGADWTIEGVVDLATRTGLPRIVIGATIVSLGTTLPEAFVSVMAAWMGNPGLALGNGVGSIIADTGLIFGLTCVLARVPMNRFILDRTGWVQVGAATLLVILSIAALVLMPEGPRLEKWVGILFLILLVGYLYMTYYWAKQGGLADEETEEDHVSQGLMLCFFMIFGGLILVVLSARALVPAASVIAVRIGVPEDVIASTMVAFGTSLPELVTAITAVRKGHPEIMVGNVVGADVLNCLFVIGAASVVSPLQIPPNFFYFHFPAMLIILYSFRGFISFSKGNGTFRRWQGAWLLAVYLVYVGLQYGLNAGSS